MPVPAGLDGAWIESAATPIRVAHARGASAHADANSLAALGRAAKDGFHLFEVDLWIDPAGSLRCQHDDETALPLAAGDCTLDRLLPRIASMGGWVVLDIKSDFERTGRAVIQMLRASGLGPRVVFQLYRADDMGPPRSGLVKCHSQSRSSRAVHHIAVSSTSPTMPQR